MLRVSDFDSDTYRAAYTVEFKQAVYVFPASAPPIAMQLFQRAASAPACNSTRGGVLYRKVN